MARLQVPPDQPMDHAPMERGLKNHEIRYIANILRAELEKNVPILTRYGPLRETPPRLIQAAKANDAESDRMREVEASEVSAGLDAACNEANDGKRGR